MARNLALDLSLSRRRSRANLVAQLRALLFGAGERGWLYHNADPATMWQDLARTVPVTAEDQPVRIQNDLSGNGNHRSQPTSDASRPLYTRDAQGRLGLRYDGTDDWLRTGTITPGTDKAQLFGVYRKLSDAAAFPILVETSNGPGNNGSLVLATSTAGGADYYGGSRGTAFVAIDTPNTFPAPITNVITLTADIAAPSVALRVNGVASVSSSATQGTGNFLAYPAFFGRRGGSSLPFNGHELGVSIGRFGPNLTLAQIQQVEALLNQIAGGVY